MATSGRGTGRNRPRGTAGPARSRPQSRRVRGSQPRGGTSRGAAARTGRGTPVTAQTQRPRLTGRAAIVIVVLAILFVSYASSLRAFLAQRSHINELEAQIGNDRRAIAELREERRRWTDEAFIEAQARERFGWVMPGEAGFRVIGKDGEPLDTSFELTDPTSLGRDPDAQWWSATWTSIRKAGVDESAGPAPARRLGPPVRDRGGADRADTPGSGRGR